MKQNEIQLLYDCDEWMDIHLLEVIPALTQDQYKKYLGSSFGEILGTIVHSFLPVYERCLMFLGKNLNIFLEMKD